MGKFKLDENLPLEANDVLLSAGHDALSVMDQQLGGQSDTNIAAVCQQECRVIVTLDLDFADIRTYPPADYSGIVVLRLARLDKRTVLSVIQRLTALFEQEPIVGKLWIVDESSVRVRS